MAPLGGGDDPEGDGRRAGSADRVTGASAPGGTISIACGERQTGPTGFLPDSKFGAAAYSTPLAPRNTCEAISRKLNSRL